MTQSKGRIESLDALRGFALLGILVVNIQVFSGWGFLGAEGRESLTWSKYDSDLLLILKVLAHDKFYSLFSLLFGYSFMMLAHKKGSAAAPYHLRRMLGLAIIGLAHNLLLWPWDILLLYALVGLLLTPFLNSSPKSLTLWAGALLLLTGLARWYWLAFDPAQDWSERVTEIWSNTVPVMSGGQYLEVVQANLQLLLANTMDRLEDLRPVRVMAMFLLGAAAARLKLAEPESGHRKLLGFSVLLILPLALTLAIVEQMVSQASFFEQLSFVVAETLAGPLTAIGYASLLILWWNGRGLASSWTCAAFAPAGRMALTNYLAQSAVCVPLFYGFGLGLFAEWSLTKSLWFCAALFLAQLILSHIWLSFFRQGPLEWLWRWQIQGSRPALRS